MPRLNPSTRLTVGLRAALRRRYGYAALRVLRRALGRALADHIERSISREAYSGGDELRQIRQLYKLAIRRLGRKFPDLDFGDPRSQP